MLLLTLNCLFSHREGVTPKISCSAMSKRQKKRLGIVRKGLVKEVKNICRKNSCGKLYCPECCVLFWPLQLEYDIAQLRTAQRRAERTLKSMEPLTIHWSYPLGKQTTDREYDSGLQTPYLYRESILGTDKLFSTIQELGGN